MVRRAKSLLSVLSNSWNKEEVSNHVHLSGFAERKCNFVWPTGNVELILENWWPQQPVALSIIILKSKALHKWWNCFNASGRGDSCILSSFLLTDVKSLGSCCTRGSCDTSRWKCGGRRGLLNWTAGHPCSVFSIYYQIQHGGCLGEKQNQIWGQRTYFPSRQF